MPLPRVGRPVEGLQSEVEVRRNAAKAGLPRRRPAQVSNDGFDESDRSQPA
jgi:hypothetical protein